jgi:phosphatidylglycerol:prolipoprotein diacylglycerol transferase
MHPHVLGVPAFLAVLPFAVGAGMALPLWLARRRGLPAGRLMAFLASTALVGLAGAKLYSIVERGEIGAWTDELGTGFRYPGGILAILLALPLLRWALPRTLTLAGMLDLMAPGIGVAMAIMRVHCLLSGCCAGFVCGHAWCIVYPHESPPFQHQMIAGLIAPSAPASLPLHPLPVYFMLASLAATAVALWWLPRARYAGQTFLLFLAVNESAKAALELLRFPDAPLVRQGSLLVAAVAVAGLLAGRLRGQRQRRGALDAEAA